MIMKTLYTRNSAVGWVGYIGYKSKIGDVQREYMGVFNGVGRRATRREIEEIVGMSEDIGLARMVIFSPVRPIHPIFLAEYTRNAIWKFIQSDGRTSVKFVYALHYNTSHPHSHVVLSAYFQDDLLMYEKNIKALKKIATREFGEDMDIHRTVEKSAKVRDIERRLAEYEKRIKLEHKEEVKEIASYQRRVKTVDDVWKDISIEV